MRERVLVTGATGFVGRQVIGPLADLGFEVHGVGRRAPCPAPTGSQSLSPSLPHSPSLGLPMAFHAVDLLDGSAGARLIEEIRPTRVLHLAWYVAHGVFWEAAENEAWVAATLRLGRICRAAGVARFVGVGTCAEYDLSHRPGAARREDDPLGATSAYGRAKIAAFRGLEGVFAGGETSFAWARLFHLFGPGEAAGRLVPSLLAALAAGESFRVGAPQAVRDFSSTEAMLTAPVSSLATSRASCRPIASGRAVTIGDFAREIAAERGGVDLVEAAGEGGAGDVITADVGRARRAGLT